MEDYHPGTYGDSFADVYDDWYGEHGGGDPTAAVDLLASLAAGRNGPVLELGVGSGRLALPLAARGFPVWGIDASAAMIARLRDNAAATGPVESALHPIVGDMAALPFGPGSHFGLAFVAANTLFNLPRADLQARCLVELARCVETGGALVIEAFVPNDEPDQPVSAVEAPMIELGRVVLTASRRDPADQVVIGQHIEITEAGVRLRPWKIRYCSPAQLDTMAGAAGWELDQRWASWARTSFDETSPAHVSVYRRAGATS